MIANFFRELNTFILQFSFFSVITNPSKGESPESIKTSPI
nr:MAG TPA: hypothetical protein [Caudoviricetes sp.]